MNDRNISKTKIFDRILSYLLIFFRELAEALDIDAEGSRPEQSNPVNMPTSLRHGSVPVSYQ